ncbi:preprotein translocase subunit SecA [bacterium (Candidatus Gribaldobacteria) CG_4_10_14_0_2_um_filter_41_16]|uniref:Protein translocase subunit SecA n=4 Tax=Candidatus Gribaldobacteria TaxID=2798536 RepID=A0A2M7VIG2_9BACT|nr:MAG: preprotein translocase subunit SecA [Parcubacteria group bacterium CG1_02_41_26]PIR91513.1 MAG: preprotein translocase subunit SecA [bacterium (Candidatus Gribaldobacteria) CG10_big_fil_rev_8_21_14_0_10_41_12]PIV47433.1 MAG: preprotein translocase subunit SecA [bacterium (Candidatus Gribaldobacteria) CG02_land_8_20_14_3_00_41_15]PIX03467.1 MAG: preprotein translocase subunit SecA [bacterium (Candidatus Gribaldobacteria) CG_4_8_14_3_um_filter_42_11]PJA01449.1 MAG: preprotein translocase 
MSFLSKILGDPLAKTLKTYQSLVASINDLEPSIEKLNASQMKEKTLAFKQSLQDGQASLDDILPEAFALAREAARRTLGQRPYDAQLIGGLVLHQGKIAEMKTGEGKTLAATLPAYLNGLTGKGVHIVTVNDYLAERDAVWMGQIYNYLGLSVGCIVNNASYLYDENFGKEDDNRDKVGGFKVEKSFLRPCSRKEAYLADIVYGTNNEFAFDYLRDNMVFETGDMAQRGFNFAVVDEIDSILIDEARTPLIISQPDLESSNYYKEFSRIVPQLKKDIDFEVDEKAKSAFLTEPGIEKVEKILGLKNIYEEKGMRYLHYLEQALRAQTLFQRDRDYLVKNNEVLIIDEFTGRILPGRRYSGGLHQALEAKERVEVKPESKILATITFQNYFRLYQKLAGMTGTALTSAEEFDKVYKLAVVPVPTNKPMSRNDLSDLIYKTETAKFKAVVAEVKDCYKKGQPVLVGTRSVEKNEYLSKLLAREGVKHEVINAKNHAREGEIIAQAGRLFAVTVATNMAGRGVDIVLGGNPPQIEEAEKVKALGGLRIIGTERHEARRIDNQLRGRAGRQGDPGLSQFFVSLEDELMRIFGGDRIKKLMEMMKIPEDQPITAKIINSALEKAQSKVEGLNFDARQHVLEYDDVMAKHRFKIYSQRAQTLIDDYQQLKDFVWQILEKELSGLTETIEEIKTIMPLSEEIIKGLQEAKDQDKALQILNNHAKQLWQEKEAQDSQENLLRLLRFVVLRCLDFWWIEHLINMDHLKDSVNLRAYGGRDPLAEYKTEGHQLFQELWKNVNSQIARTIFKVSFTA